MWLVQSSNEAGKFVDHKMVMNNKVNDVHPCDTQVGLTLQWSSSSSDTGNKHMLAMTRWDLLLGGRCRAYMKEAQELGFRQV